MSQLTPLHLDDGSVIYIEATAAVVSPVVPGSDETTRTSKGVGEEAVQRFEALQGTIRSYTSQTLEAFKGMSSANVDKVKLEFGVKVSGEVGVPYITKGSSDCNLKITVECSFPD